MLGLYLGIIELTKKASAHAGIIKNKKGRSRVPQKRSPVSRQKRNDEKRIPKIIKLRIMSCRFINVGCQALRRPENG